jgi:hypothetical protein
MKFDRQKYNYFMEALLSIQRHDLVKSLVKVDKVKSKKPTDTGIDAKQQFPKKVTETIEKSKKVKEAEHDKYYKGQTDADQLPSAESKDKGADKSGKVEVKTEKAEKQEPSLSRQSEISEKLYKGIGNGDTESGERSKQNKVIQENTGNSIFFIPDIQ